MTESRESAYWDDAHHIRSAKDSTKTLCGQDAAKLHTLAADTTVWPDANAACWTCWDMRGAELRNLAPSGQEQRDD